MCRGLVIGQAAKTGLLTLAFQTHLHGLNHCRQFVTKESIYPFTSGSTNKAGTCNKARTASLGLEDKVQLTGSGFKQLRPWSAAALREVSGRVGCGQVSAQRGQAYEVACPHCGSRTCGELNVRLPVLACTCSQFGRLIDRPFVSRAGSASGTRDGGNLRSQGQHV